MSASYYQTLSNWATLSESPQLRNNDHNSRASTSDWYDSHSMDFNYCSPCKRAWPNIHVNPLASSNTSGCTCPSSVPDGLTQILTGHADGSLFSVRSCREVWFATFETLKKPTESGKDRLTAGFKALQLKEYESWIRLSCAVWELANKRRAQITEINSRANAEVTWSEDEQEALLTHMQDLRVRGIKAKNKPITHCFQHGCVGDYLPVRQVSSYNNCGICVLQHDSVERQQRIAEDRRRAENSEQASLVASGSMRPTEAMRIFQDETSLNNPLNRARAHQQAVQRQQQQIDSERPQPRSRGQLNKRGTPYDEYEPDLGVNEWDQQNNNGTSMYNNNNTELKQDDDMYFN